MSPPRFLRAGDRARMPVLLRNLTSGALEARWAVDGELGPKADGVELLAPGATRAVEIDLQAGRPAAAAIEARVRTEIGGDAERRTVPVLPQGIAKAGGAVLAARDGDASLTLRVPAGAEPGTITLRGVVEPAYLQAMVAALPYLLDYPYGCTEQTMNRFLPLLAAAEAAEALGLEPTGRLAELPAMIEAGLDRLRQLQHEDGGFGWWERDATDPGMTALVLRGLTRVLAGDPENARARAMRDAAAQWFLHDGRMVQGGLATTAAVLAALAEAGALPAPMLPPASDPVYGGMPPLVLALRLRAAVALGRADLVAAIAGLLDDEARREADGGIWWSAGHDDVGEPARWQDDAVQATAAVLHALVLADAPFALLDGAARWLLGHRDGGDRWRSTRDTGAVVEALAALTAKTGDLGAGKAVALAVDGRTVFSGTCTREDAIAGRTQVEIPDLEPGAEVVVTLSCPEGAAFASLALRYHETGPAIAASQNGFGITRRFFQLTPSDAEGRVTWTRTPVTETVPSGALVECEIVVATPRLREYVMVTSPHAAGFEPATEVAMDVPGREAAAESRVERHDDRTLFFVASLPEGRAVFRHLLRATHVGAFTTLPAQVELMYFPDVRGNSDGEVFTVSAAGPAGVETSDERNR